MDNDRKQDELEREAGVERVEPKPGGPQEAPPQGPPPDKPPPPK